MAAAAASSPGASSDRYSMRALSFWAQVYPRPSTPTIGHVVGYNKANESSIVKSNVHL